MYSLKKLCILLDWRLYPCINVNILHVFYIILNFIRFQISYVILLVYLVLVLLHFFNNHALQDRRPQS